MSDDVWLAAMLPFVRESLPPAPARVLELGCGPLGGFVPALRVHGYDAVGIDPEAPDGSDFRRIEFEAFDADEPIDAFVASASLHHVADLDVVFDKIESMLAPGATLVVIEWAHERFDEATARWCFDRVRTAEHSWLVHHRERWQESGQSWDEYFASWVTDERLHRAVDIVRALASRFQTRSISDGPYLFADLDGVSSADEQAAIDAGEIQPGCVRYVGVHRASAA